METLGVVPYLNTEPFLAFLEGTKLLKQSPAKLEQSYQRGEVQSALLPVLSVFRGVKGYIIDGLCIGSHREALSVLVFLNCALEKVQKVGLDENSLSSRYLTQLLFQEYYHLDCRFEVGNPQNWMQNWGQETNETKKTKEIKKTKETKKPLDAYLMIGDLALSHKKDRIEKSQRSNQKHREDSEQEDFLDLGKVWHEWTGLPFVFAIWVSKEKDFALKKRLEESLEKGMQSIQAILEKRFSKLEGWESTYLRKNLFYFLGKREKQALLFYQKVLHEKGFISELLPLCFY